MTKELPENSIVKSASEMWKSGVSLDRAPDVFGAIGNSSKIRRKARLIATENAELGKANFKKVGKNLDELFDALGSVQASFVGAAQVRFAKEDSLIERLRSGELTAWGFPVHDQSATEPQQVPPFMLNRDFARWKKRAFVGHDRHYADVTVCEVSHNFQSSPATPVVTERKRRGPKTIAPLIAAAIDQLRSDDPNFENRSQEKKIIAIQAEVARQNPGRYPGTTQPGHTTVWHYVTGRRALV